MPVGRISYLFMEPLSFMEFLSAGFGKQLREYLAQVDMKSGMEKIYQKKLNEILKKYLIVGGMPKAAAAYFETGSMTDVKMLQTSIVQTFQADFAKYATTAKHRHLRDVFRSTPGLVGRQCKYAHINPHVPSREIKHAVELLSEARVIHPVHHSSGQGIPLDAHKNPKKFKLLFLDVGLMQNALGLDAQIALNDNIMQINRGSTAEQFIGQQLLTAQNPFEERRLFFWAREAKAAGPKLTICFS